MADLSIHRAHALGMSAARDIARQWHVQAQQDYGLRCVYVEGAEEDAVQFSRSGVSGRLQVRADAFVLEARLGFMLSTFKQAIETEIGKNLDALLDGPGQAFQS